MSDGKRIAKNTLMLYLRMFLVMGISLYTSRIVLAQLGIVDYGIYNVVGGVVAMFGFINASMASSTQRYLTFDLGRKDLEHLNITFNTSLLIHVLIALVVVSISEIGGVWFMYNKMQIPPDRMTAAFWVFQFSLASMIVTFINVPYNAMIIAYEKMSAFAYISILEVVMKLGIAFLLMASPIDRLIYFAILNFVSSIIVRIIYTIYCSRNFAAVKLRKIFNKSLFKEMSGFAGWSLFGQLAAIGFTQGLNVLLNMFFGPSVNAARGVAVQVQGAVSQFSMNFQTAINPQITKSYAQEDFDNMHMLVCRSSKFTYFLLFALTLPILLETPYILNLWLKDVPDYTVPFIRIIMWTTIIDSMANPLMVAAAASGRIKKYQSVVGGLLLFILPVSYIVLKFGGNPQSVFIVHLTICMVAFVTRLYLVQPLVGMKPGYFIKRVVLRCGLTTLLSLVVPWGLYSVLPTTFLNVVIVILVSVASVCFSAYYVGLDGEEKQFLRNFVKQKLHLR